MRTAVHVTLSAAAALATLSGCGGDGPTSADVCPALSPVLVRDLASRTSTVVQGAVERRAPLTDATTSSEGLLVRVDRTLTGPATPERIAIWSDLTTPPQRQLDDGSGVVAFLNTHTAATTADGQQVPAYDFAAANGLLTVADGKVRAQCRDSAGEAVDANVLDVLGQ